MDEINDIFLALSSHRHSQRLDAFSKIEAIASLDILQAFTLKSFDSNDNELFLISINKLEKMTLSPIIEMASFSVWALNHFSHISNSSISTMANEAMEKFCLERKVSENFKNLCFRFAITKTDVDKRSVLIQLSTKYKFFATVHFIVDQLQYGSDEKKIDAIRSLVSFQDTRGLFYIRSLVKSNNLELAKEALDSLAFLGTHIDALWIMFNFKKLPSELASTAFSTIRKISPDLALWLFKSKYRKSSKEIKIAILKECALIKTSFSLRFILRCFLQETSHAVLYEALRSIYNIETTKKISTLTSFFKKSTPDKRFHLINMIADFHDERCRLFFTSVVQSNAHSFVKRTCLEKLCYYHHPKTLELIFSIANDETNPFRGVALSSIFSQFKLKYKARAFKMIAPIEVSDFIHFRVLKSVPAFINDSKLSPEMIEYLLKQYNDGGIEKKFIVLDIFKNYHNESVFGFVVTCYHETTHLDLKHYLKDTFQDILNAFPYYVSQTSPVKKLIPEVLSDINFQQIDYRLLLHLCRLSISDDELFNFTKSMINIIGPRLENIILDTNLSFEEKRFITVFLVKSRSHLSEEISVTIQSTYFPYFPPELKDLYLAHLIKTKQAASFDFINFNIYYSKDMSLRKDFYQFTGELL